MELKLKIVDLLSRYPGKKFTMNEIAEELGEHYSFAYRIINRLHEQKVIKKEKVGKSHLCTLNLKNEKTVALIKLSEIERREEFLERNKQLKLILKDFINAVSDKGDINSVLLFGSYAKNIQSETSDIDILILTKSDLELEKAMGETYAKYGEELNAIAMTPSDFKKEIEEPIIKEIIENHFILYGVDKFINLVYKNEV